MDNSRLKVIETKEEYENRILQYRQKGYEYLKLIDKYLYCKDKDSIEAYISIFMSEEFLQLYVPCLEDLGYARVFAAITLEELKNSRTCLFINHGDSVMVLKRFYTKIKFLLWNMEFKIEDDAENQLCEYLEANRISIEAIRVIMLEMGFDKRTSYLTLITNYLGHQRFDEGIRLLEYAAEDFPEDMEILTLLVQLCRAVGNDLLADKYEEQLRDNHVLGT